MLRALHKQNYSSGHRYEGSANTISMAVVSMAVVPADRKRTLFIPAPCGKIKTLVLSSMAAC